MNINKETQEKIQELQIIEQNIHSLMLQIQAFQLELNETENALSEIAKSGEEVYKIIGNIMLKFPKNEIEKELKEKKEIISLRLNSLEKQESNLKQKSEKFREEVVKIMENSEKK